MRIILAGLACSLMAVSAPAGAAEKPANVSWAKPGVPFDVYRRDALECANKTYGIDVSMKPDTVRALSAQNTSSLAAFISGLNSNFRSDSLSYRNGLEGYRAAMNVVEPGRAVFRNSTYTSLFRNAAYEDVTDQLQAVLDYCLVSRGYRKMSLTHDQNRQLREYPHGSEQRAHFLHRISAAD